MCVVSFNCQIKKCHSYQNCSCACILLCALIERVKGSGSFSEAGRGTDTSRSACVTSSPVGPMLHSLIAYVTKYVTGYVRLFNTQIKVFDKNHKAKPHFPHKIFFLIFFIRIHFSDLKTGKNQSGRETIICPLSGCVRYTMILYYKWYCTSSILNIRNSLDLHHPKERALL